MARKPSKKAPSSEKKRDSAESLLPFPEGAQIQQILAQRPSGFLSLAWSPDHQQLAAAATDGCVWVFALASGEYRLLEGHTNAVLAVAWSPDGRTLASGSDDSSVRLWEADSGRALRTLQGHTNAVLAVAWSPDGRTLASGSDDGTVRLWGVESEKPGRIFESPFGPVSALAWSPDGHWVVAAGQWGSLSIWSSRDGQLLAQRAALPFRRMTVALVWGNQPQVPQRLGDVEMSVETWTPAPADKVAELQVLLTSAKVVLVGDSDVGKSCLALRLAEKRYEARGTTHGMAVWTLPAEQLHPGAVPPAGQQREIFLWDLGGQTEYQLVHQLFLHDTTVALVLFDATRGEANYAAVEDWNRRLELQARGNRIRKILVRSKADLKTGVINQQKLQTLQQQCHFGSFHEVSAKTGEGVDRLCDELNRLLAWDELATITRPPAYQSIHELIEKQSRQAAILFYSELAKQLEKRDTACEATDLNTVLRQLALEGQIVDVNLATGDRVLVLGLEAISRYAGSLILAARDHPRGVPLLEPRQILAPTMQFPGLQPKDRLDRASERVLVECVVQLLLERGICFEHAGMLVFPTLFTRAAAAEGEGLPHPRPLYYDFDGPIDNIYAALVARLAVSSEFGGVRL